MLIRYAEFVGHIHEGKEGDFFRFVAEVLTPLWTKFDGAVKVAVCQELERDKSAPEIPLVLAISYPDRAALDQAMACDARFKSREETQHLLEMFDGTVYHRVTEAVEHNLEAAR